MNAYAIVKALKCCNVSSGRACSECSYHEVGAECRTQRNKDAAELIIEMSKAYDDLEYILMGVMHFVDKWLDGKDLDLDEVNRALRMREKTLQIVEKLTEENEKLRKENHDFKNGYFQKRYEENADAELLAVKAAWRKSDFAYIDLNAECEGKLKTIKADTVRKMQEKIRAKSEYGTINISPWQLEQIAKEVLEENK